MYTEERGQDKATGITVRFERRYLCNEKSCRVKTKGALKTGISSFERDKNDWMC